LKKASSNYFVDALLGAIDGYLQSIDKPRKGIVMAFLKHIGLGIIYAVWIECSSCLQYLLLFPILWCCGTRKMSRLEGI